MAQSPIEQIRFRVVALAMFWLAVGWIGCLSSSADVVREQRPDSWRQDAAIHDVHFVDANHGWAVGEQGLILRTTDGGRNWFELGRVGISKDGRSLLGKLNQLQPVTESAKQNPIRCRLDSVHFTDASNGWISGSYTIPYMGRSRAVVLKSSDGGVSWAPVEGIVLPQIKRLHFQSRTDGWAVGQSGNLYKTGIFYTRNGGQSWSTQGSQKLKNWCDADGIGDFDLVTVSQDGTLGVVRQNEYEPSVILCPERPHIRAVRMLDDQNGWAAGDRGVLLRTRDGAASWRPVDTSAMPGISGFDFYSLTLIGDRVFVAGNPGTYLFSIAADTGEVRRHRTPITSQIHKIYFTSSTHGWAVGDLGCILATQDAGMTWAVQRSGADRVGALMVSVHPRQLPLEMIARFSSEENILSSALCLTQDLQNDVRSAASRLGCAVTQTLPAEASSSSQETMRHLVRSLRAQRPNVVIVNEDPSGQVHLIGLMREAIRIAADRSQYVTQLTENGLTPWQVERLVFTTPQIDAEIHVDSKKLLPRVGNLIEDYIAISRAQLGLSVRAVGPSLKGYTFENFGAISSVRDGDPFSGLDASGPEVPRRHGVTRMGNLNAINRASAKQKQLDHFLSWEIKSNADLVYWRQQLQGLALGLEPSAVGVWLMQLADQYVERGKPQMAAYTLELMINRVGEHALMPSALMWLSQYYSSDEFCWQAVCRERHWQMSRQSSDAAPPAPQSVARNVTVNGTTTLVWEPIDASTEESSEIVPANHETAVHEPDFVALTNHRLELASRFLARLKRFDPELGLAPQVRFLEAQILQKLQGPVVAKNQFRALVRASNTMDPITTVASLEMSLADKGPLTGQRLKCFPADSRPRLDGELDDAVWQTALAQEQVHWRSVVDLENGPTAKKDLLMLAYDKEFLFIAARCQKIPGQSYQDSRLTRQRDDDLSMRDRLEITLDLDRDYRSVCQFVIDHRGWAGDRLGGSQGWNPKWFIDQSQNSETWIVEAAIPLAELTGRPVEPGTVMAARVNRLSYDSSQLWVSEASRQAQHSRVSGLLECLGRQPRLLQLIEFKP